MRIEQFTFTRADGKSVTVLAATPEELLEQGAPPSLVEVARLSALRWAGLAKVAQVASEIRARITGTSDPAKLAEYADKALSAQSIVDGTAHEDLVASAETELMSLKALNKIDADATIVDLAQIWLVRAGALRRLRAEVGAAEREAESAVKAADSDEEVENAISMLRVKASKA